MSKIVVAQTLEAPAGRVWEHLADLASHSSWMKDAASIRFQTERTSGLGTSMIVPTKVGPLRTTDLIEVVEWNEGSSIKVSHRGLVTGTGEFSIEDGGTRSEITWREELSFPWWLGGRFTAWVAAPILRRIWEGNLKRFAGIVEGSTT